MSKVLFQKLKTIEGGRFVGIKGYKSKTSGEIANHIVNLAISVEKIKLQDLKKLQSPDADAIAEEISVTENIAFEVCKTALNEMRESALKNVGSFDERTTNSVAQTDAYLTHPDYPSMRIHKETMELHIFGMANQKKVIKEGKYKKVKSRPKTIAKKLISKRLNLRASKFRTFVVGHIDRIKINGEEIQM